MAIVSISIVPVTNAWNDVSAAYRALTAAIRKKPQPNTVLLWQKFALACQVLANAMWKEERDRSPIQTPPEPPPPTPQPEPEPPFDPRITTWVSSDGEQNFDFPSCPFKVGNP